MKKITILVFLLLAVSCCKMNALEVVNGAENAIEIRFLDQNGKVDDSLTQVLEHGEDLPLYQDLFSGISKNIKIRWSRKLPSGRGITEFELPISDMLLDSNNIILITKAAGHTPLTHKLTYKVMSPEKLPTDLKAQWMEKRRSQVTEVMSKLPEDLLRRLVGVEA